jgi:hypothetical protein
MSDPSRRCRRWLRAYPAAYRREKGDEILATLLDASTEQGPGILDLLFVAAHASRVRLRILAERWTGRTALPQPVRLATWILVGAAVAAWYDSLSVDNGPRNPGLHFRGVGFGFVLILVHALIQARRRLTYAMAIAVPAGFETVMILESPDPGTGALLGLPFAVVALLLLAGWRRYAAAVRG